MRVITMHMMKSTTIIMRMRCLLLLPGNVETLYEGRSKAYCAGTGRAGKLWNAAAGKGNLTW